jgi:hypothetical protein
MVSPTIKSSAWEPHVADPIDPWFEQIRQRRFFSSRKRPSRPLVIELVTNG